MNLNYARRSEDTEQIKVISWAKWQEHVYPALGLLYHCPNGGSRNRAEAVKLKQMGVRAGVPDLHLPAPKGIYPGLYIEMKYQDGRLGDSQKEFLRLAAQAGNYCAVCYGAEMAINVLTEYLRLREREEMAAPNLCIFQNGKVRKIHYK